MVLVLVISSFGMAYAQDEIKLEFNGKQLILDSAPYIKDGRTLVPFRKVLEAFDSQISWNGVEQVITAKQNGVEIYLKIGENYAYVNGEEVRLDVPPQITNGRAFVPLRFVSENLGAEVTWDGVSRTISVSYNNSVYKLGQTGTYNGLRYSIDGTDSTSEYGKLKISGKISEDLRGLKLDIADGSGYVISADLTVWGKDGDMYNMEAEVSVPTCHNFQGKYFILKMPNKDKKLIKIAEYVF